MMRYAIIFMLQGATRDNRENEPATRDSRHAEKRHEACRCRRCILHTRSLADASRRCRDDAAAAAAGQTLPARAITRRALIDI